MPDYTKRWIELRRREQQADGSWGCRYVIFECGSRGWRCKKGSADGTFKTPEEAAAAALTQAQRIIDSLQPSASRLS